MEQAANLTSRGSPGPHSGFTLVEIAIALAIVAVLAMLAMPAYEGYRERLRVLQAVTDIGHMGSIISQFGLDNRRFPDSLADVGLDGRIDPWGRPYRYSELASEKGKGGARKDRQLNPLNTDFDLYSVGKDGQSVPPLPPTVSHDDVIRARDGRFIGLGQDFDP